MKFFFLMSSWGIKDGFGGQDLEWQSLYSSLWEPFIWCMPLSAIFLILEGLNHVFQVILLLPCRICNCTKKMSNLLLPEKKPLMARNIYKVLSNLNNNLKAVKRPHLKFWRSLSVTTGLACSVIVSCKSWLLILRWRIHYLFFLITSGMFPVVFRW